MNRGGLMLDFSYSFFSILSSMKTLPPFFFLTFSCSLTLSLFPCPFFLQELVKEINRGRLMLDFSHSVFSFCSPLKLFLPPSPHVFFFIFVRHNTLPSSLSFFPAGVGEGEEPCGPNGGLLSLCLFILSTIKSLPHVFFFIFVSH